LVAVTELKATIEELKTTVGEPKTTVTELRTSDSTGIERFSTVNMSDFGSWAMAVLSVAGVICKIMCTTTSTRCDDQVGQANEIRDILLEIFGCCRYLGAYV
jgi:hypothetical protein